jgi:hypothetical protein
VSTRYQHGVGAVSAWFLNGLNIIINFFLGCVSCSFEDYFGMIEEQALEDVSIEPILGPHLAKKATPDITTTTTTSPSTTSTPSIPEQSSSPPNPLIPENIELALLNHMELPVVPKINRRKMVIDNDYEVDDADNEEDDDGYDAKDMDREEQWNQKKQGKEVILVEDDLLVDNLEDDAVRQDAVDRKNPHKPAAFNRMCTLLLFYIF